MIALIGHRRSLKRFFQKRNMLMSGMTIIDAGCGSGALTRALWELAQEQHLSNVHFFGFDLTRQMLDQFQSWIDRDRVTNVQLLQADLLNLPPTPYSLPQANIIVTSGMLEYIPRDRFVEALKNLKSLLKPDGRLFIFISRTGWQNNIMVEKLWHANLYSQPELQTSCHSAGLSIISLKSFKTWGFAIELREDGPTIA